MLVLHIGEGPVAYGESAPDELRLYSEETLGSARDLTPGVLAPRIAGQEFDSPEAVDAALRENVRGNPFARAGIETAAWDLEAHRRGTGLPRSEEHTSELQSQSNLVCRLLLEKKKNTTTSTLM